MDYIMTQSFIDLELLWYANQFYIFMMAGPWVHLAEKAVQLFHSSVFINKLSL